MGLIGIAIVLGVVEGLTEFLPVSSTGHLIVAGRLLGLHGEKADAFEIFIQLGAVLAVIYEYRRTLAGSVAGALRPGPDQRFLAGLGVAFVPAAAAGLALHGWIERHLFTPRVVAGALIIGGLAIFAVEAWLRSRARAGLAGRFDDARGLPLTVALWIGLAQTLSLCPGVSRAAATILGGLLAGLTRRAATEFSFYLAIPTLGAACLYSLLKVGSRLSPSDAAFFGAGFAVSFAVALAVIRLFLAWIRSRDFVPFAWYRIAFGMLVIWVTTPHAPPA